MYKRQALRAQAAAAKIRQKITDAKVSGEENSAACALSGIIVLTVPFAGHAACLLYTSDVYKRQAPN